ncbi:MAG: glycosyltransferase family 2 protein [Chloroflexi bacterium]|nr:MAG: glycosyltransferase family 2 protein [Chloroflexota bacterium]
MRVSLIIPALNEAECLVTLLTEVPVSLIHQVIVVDNGSTDGTAEVAQVAGALVIREPQRGYGFACATGATAAEGELLVFMDGDGSFVPGELPNLLEPLIQGEADLVLGSRMRKNGVIMPPHQRLGNLLFAWLLRQRFDLILTDLGPYRAIRRELFMALDMREHTYGWPLEMIIKTARRHRPIVEVSVTYRPRFAGHSKVGGTLRGSVLPAYRFLHVMLRYAF